MKRPEKRATSVGSMRDTVLREMSCDNLPENVTRRVRPAEVGKQAMWIHGVGEPAEETVNAQALKGASLARAGHSEKSGVAGPEGERGGGEEIGRQRPITPAIIQTWN